MAEGRQRYRTADGRSTSGSRDVLTDLVRRAWETNHEQPC